ncbi:MAG: methyltransferase [Desulfovibrio sp.]|uniref:methyltransferase n=1 Tax=Desulfovibrio sp. TaxID=885 RepID=UPI00135D44B2|nr:methyltransferase [Desulfovibrio sp.]MTJ93863.1 methyltransferase [Desulfovibrio sp.]
MTIAISPDVRIILGNATIEGNVLKLSGQLDRSAYVQVNKVLEGLGGRWNRGKGGHIFQTDPSELLAGVLEDGSYVNRQKNLQLFETPADLAERMVEIASVSMGDLALEPSAGRGRLVLPLLKRGAKVCAVDIDAQNVGVLKSIVGDLDVTCADFLEWGERQVGDDAIYDAIVMNPPFSNDQAARHTMFAWQLLKPGGRLVSICDAGVFYRDRGLAPKFRQWMDSIRAEMERMAAGTFRSSGTDVASCLIWATKF